MIDKSDLDLLGELGVNIAPDKKVAHSPREERIIAGFEEIQRFVDQHGRPPVHGEENDIFERLYATRLDQIRQQAKCRELLRDLDHQGLLDDSYQDEAPTLDELNDDELLTQLGVPESSEGDVTHLKHVKSRAEIRAAEEIASRMPCKDFDKFKPLFETVQTEIENGIREIKPFRDYAEILEGDFFILSGQKAYVAEVGEEFLGEHGRPDARLRLIYDNGTESDLLMRSLQRALNKDPAGRRITDNSPGPLFSGVMDGEELASGIIYVLRSQSDHPVIEKSRDVIHKIGVTSGSVEKRIANAKLDPTFLMAKVDVVAEYTLYNINRSKLEKLIHTFFNGARLDIEINDRFGHPVVPREWFLVPLFVIDDVVEKIKDGTIGRYVYDMKSAALVSDER
ncbi:MAG: GIY-YIG nuclease family protein [Gammaproteobacteria bacterium]|nr:GIY-YIG nuclease family protein [Gammaproteobacteria bacterium]MCF6258917.1 GIY-YIG nuclease family protein [Gammaproteobacteria bacterium]